MWTRANFVVSAGIGVYDESEDETESGTDDLDDDCEASQACKAREKPAGYDIWIASYEKLKKIYPDLERDLASDKKKYATKSKIETLLQDGIKSARQADTSCIKTNIDHLFNFQPSIAKTNKIYFGFSNDQTGKLLTPVQLSWDNTEHRERLQKKLEEIKHDDFFFFMYEDQVCDPTALNKGLLRSDILVKAVLAILFGPSAVKCSEPGPSDTKAKKAGNADLGGITKVTPGLIAYAACLVRFALSSESLLTPGDGQGRGFDNCAFYRSLVSLLETPTSSPIRKKWRKELLSWWNAIFPKSIDDLPTRSAGSLSTMDQLLAQEETEEREANSGAPPQ
ncbi:hypothetical protein M407DRAFT_8591 [Tulasnella calospora MUT 4182]|uniref:Uncharacterized protein n=1 Tax=Tulasnella calospora MUT 4182 TaxID=1051891 RepID=A0A0C3Q6S5_9AGAM|nr:hypothetical protein M407DRAFT_8591 [Tulasnella calospora MUT 4182]